MITLIEKENIKIDILYRPKIIGLGIDMGSNKIILGKIKNIFIEITIMFWTLGFEFKW